MKPSPFTLTAPKLVGLTIGGTLAGDVWLVRRRRETVSTWAGRHWWWVSGGFVLLLMHFKGQPRFMRRFDIFAASARQLRKGL